MSNNTIQIRQTIKSGVPVLLEGRTGTGKTYTILKLAEELGKTLHVINVSGELTVDSILGQQTLLDGNVVWRDGTLTAAMRKGDWVLFDELNTALPEVLTVINGVLDDSHSVTLPNADNERIKAHDDFRFIGTQNPAGGEYVGTAKLNNALLNRMVRFTIDYMDFESEVNALREHTKLKDSTIVQLVRLAQWTRERLDEHLSTRDLVKILRLREGGGMSLKDAIATVVLTRFSQDEYQRLYEYHATVMRDISEITSGNLDKDPFEMIRERASEIRTQQRELDEQKANLRETVRKEILKDLLLSGGKTGNGSVPEDF